MTDWRQRRAGWVTRVKICCISSIDEAWLAIDLGASALGFVTKMPSGPGVIDEGLITSIVATVPPGLSTFLLTSETTAQPIIEQQRRTRVNTIQLVDAVADGTYEALHRALPGVSLVQVIHVVDSESLDEAMLASKYVDALLLDSGRPNLAVKELGGTGRVHDWEISRQIRDRSPVPVYLAGGLNPSNAAAAIHAVEPFALDVCSGLRTNGRLDSAKAEAFMEGVRATPSRAITPQT